MLSEKERNEAERPFRSTGYAKPLQIAPVLSEEERVFVVASDDLASLPVIDLTTKLQDALARKVTIVTGPAWDKTEPLR